MADIEYADKFVLHEYPYAQNVVAVLGAVWDYEVPGFVGKTEINNSKRYVLEKLQKNEAPARPLRYYSYGDAVEFIDYAADEVIKRLSGESDILRIL